MEEKEEDDVLWRARRLIKESGLCVYDLIPHTPWSRDRFYKVMRGQAPIPERFHETVRQAIQKAGEEQYRRVLLALEVEE